MSNENDSFKDVHQKLRFDLISSDNGNLTKAHICQQLGVNAFQSSLGLNHTSEISNTILQEHLNNYQKTCFEKDVNNYTESCVDLIKSSNEQIDTQKWTTCLNDTFFDECTNLFNDDKKAKDITDNDVKYLFKDSKIINHISNNRDQKILSKNNETFANTQSKISWKNVEFSNSQSYYHKKSGSSSSLKDTNNVEDIADNNFNQPVKKSEINVSTANETNINSNNEENSRKLDFRTAREELFAQNSTKSSNPNNSTSNTTSSYKSQQPFFAYGAVKKSLGGRRNVQNKFIPPIPQLSNSCGNENEKNEQIVEEEDIRLKHIDPKMITIIRSEIMEKHCTVGWDDIAGLVYAKSTIQEAVVLPMLRPDIFTGLRRPPRGILLFGPPGTGKTLIGKCIASQSSSTFFSISASSLTSKWIGDGEKMVRALFAVALVHQPSVIFIDEIDSLLCQRSETEHESSRRIKTEFLVQLDGATTSDDERILVVGATNRPQELDEAARRRLTKRLYIPLPECDDRIKILNILLESERKIITNAELEEIGKLTDGFSGADMKTLCHEASMGPIRSIPLSKMAKIEVQDVRPVSFADFEIALTRVRASVSQDDLKVYEKFDKTYGSGAANK